MPTEIATAQTPVYEVTGEPGPRVLHDVCRFDILSTQCHVRTNPEGDTLFLRVGRRDFALSVLDLAAQAALQIEGKLKEEIRERVLAGRHAPATRAPLVATLAPGARVIPLRGAVEADGFITLHPGV